jgi:hypothetical protein
VLKATIASTLALAAAVSLSGCSGKSQEAAKTTPAAPAAAAQPTVPANHPTATPSASVEVSNIAKAAGGKTVAEVFAERTALANSKVTVRGKVVKLNRGIMSKDWLHVRDGSGVEGSNDLTVTTKAQPPPKVGDVVVVTGVVAVDKDFGMGYDYPVIVEDAEVVIEPAASK